MDVISVNSHVCVHKLCSLCVRSQEFNSRGITTWAEEKKDKNTVRNDATSSNLKGKPMKKNRVTFFTTGYKTRSRHR
jgi:hypothetical protein